MTSDLPFKEAFTGTLTISEGSLFPTDTLKAKEIIGEIHLKNQELVYSLTAKNIL